MNDQRPICEACKTHVVAISYSKNGKTYFKKRCNRCIRLGLVKRQVEPWQKSGYKKRPKCDKCGFVAKYQNQLIVIHADGDASNNNWFNLKTICKNCEAELENKPVWRKTRNTLSPD